MRWWFWWNERQCAAYFIFLFGATDESNLHECEFIWNEAFHFIFSFFIRYKCVQMCTCCLHLTPMRTNDKNRAFNVYLLIAQTKLRWLFVYYPFATLLLLRISSPISRSLCVFSFPLLLGAHQFCVIETIYLLSVGSTWLDFQYDDWFGEYSTVSLEMCFSGFSFSFSFVHLVFHIVLVIKSAFNRPERRKWW